MNIVFCSLRGSPGVTTLATICAAQWLDPCVLLEADLSGGVLGQRYGLSAGTPNLVSFAATARHEMTEEAIWSSCRQLPDGVAAVIAPERPEEVRRGLEQLSLSAAPDGPDLLIDGGRYSTRSEQLGSRDRSGDSQSDFGTAQPFDFAGSGCGLWGTARGRACRQGAVSGGRGGRSAARDMQRPGGRAGFGAE